LAVGKNGRLYKKGKCPRKILIKREFGYSSRRGRGKGVEGERGRKGRAKKRRIVATI